MKYETVINSKKVKIADVQAQLSVLWTREGIFIAGFLLSQLAPTFVNTTEQCAWHDTFVPFMGPSKREPYYGVLQNTYEAEKT